MTARTPESCKKGWDTRRKRYGDNGMQYKPAEKLFIIQYVCRKCEHPCGMVIDYGPRPERFARRQKPRFCPFEMIVATWGEVD
jgi:hypothetical protein